MSKSTPNEQWNFSDLDETMLNFESIQEELNYKQAQDSLRNLVNHLDLTTEEKYGMEIELNNLTAMLEKLDQAILQIAAFGMVGRGKSSVLNALLGHNIFETGPIHGVTQTIDTANWKLEGDQHIKGLQTVSLSGWGKSQIQLIDTPGIDEVDGETREKLAHEMAQQVDLILFIISGDITQVEFAALSQLREAGKPIILAFNKIDQYPETDRLVIYEKIRDERVKQLLSPDEIVMIAASPLVIEITQDSQGNLQQKRRRGTPQIEALKLKILEICGNSIRSLDNEPKLSG